MKLGITAEMLRTIRWITNGAPALLVCTHCGHDGFHCFLDMNRMAMIFACAKCEAPVEGVAGPVCLIK